MLRRARALVTLSLLLAPAGATAAEAPLLPRPRPHPTGPWLLTQAIPSPTWLFAESGGSRFALRWQITPLLYSFALRREISPWRSFVVEPLARQGGSIELHVSPEIVTSGPLSDRFVPRIGTRAYLPIFERGESLSMSLGTSYFVYRERSGVAFEGGFYVVSGLLGAQLAWSPSETGADWVFTLRLKYF